MRSAIAEPTSPCIFPYLRCSAAMDYSSEKPESFPFPLSITRDDFSASSDFDPDTFLYTKHRYTPLDSLLQDLTDLSKSLNQDLLDLVNNEHTNFIRLGQSIEGCMELMNNISLDVSKFDTTLTHTLESFLSSSTAAQKVLSHKKRLNLLKNKMKLILLLHDQCTSFDTLLGLDVGDVKADRLVTKLSTLATLFLSVSKIFAILMESVGETEEICVFFDKMVKPKVMTLKLEFKSYLDELLAVCTADTVTYGHLLLQLLHVLRVTGQTSAVLSNIKKRD
ncbi:hypothetical protein E0198_004373 [Clavispora lusitaniae]|nr:hypothetical protein E0198_004373 [Clavispora lusitaniae]